jgi:hypothetical protein
VNFVDMALGERQAHSSALVLDIGARRPRFRGTPPWLRAPAPRGDGRRYPETVSLSLFCKLIFHVWRSVHPSCVVTVAIVVPIVSNPGRNRSFNLRDPVRAGILEAATATRGIMNTAPPWYPDPQDEGFLRYWNGTAWTGDRVPVSAVNVNEQAQHGVAQAAKVPLFGARAHAKKQSQVLADALADNQRLRAHLASTGGLEIADLQRHSFGSCRSQVVEDAYSAQLEIPAVAGNRIR